MPRCYYLPLLKNVDLVHHVLCKNGRERPLSRILTFFWISTTRYFSSNFVTKSETIIEWFAKSDRSAWLALKYIVEGKKSICHVSVSVSVLVFFCNKNVYLQKWQEGHISFILFYTVYVCLKEKKSISLISVRRLVLWNGNRCFSQSSAKGKNKQQLNANSAIIWNLNIFVTHSLYFIITSKYALFLCHLLVILPFILFLFK